MKNFVRLMFFSTVLCAEALCQPTPPAIRASGNAEIKVTPDQAQIEVGVVTQARSAQDAAAQNASQMQTAISQVKAAVGTQVDIRTSRYSLSPVYAPPKTNGGKSTIESYRAVNTLVLTCNDLSVVGKAIDAATAGGANEVESLQYSLKDESPVRARALRAAAQQARANAEAMAGGLNLKLGKVLLLEQGNPLVVRPLPMAMSANGRIAGAPTPIEPGSIDVQASVTLTIAIEQ